MYKETLALCAAATLATGCDTQPQGRVDIDPLKTSKTPNPIVQEHPGVPSLDCLMNGYVDVQETGDGRTATFFRDSNGDITHLPPCEDPEAQMIVTPLAPGQEAPTGVEYTFTVQKPGSYDNHPANQDSNSSGDGNGGDGGKKPQGMGKEFPRGLVFQAEVPPTPTPAVVVENIGSTESNLIATMSEIAPGNYDPQIQYALGILGVQNPQNIVEVDIDGYNLRNRVIYIDGAYYTFDKTQDQPFVERVNGTYFDVEVALGIDHFTTIAGNPYVRPNPGTGEGNTPLGSITSGTRVRVMGETEDDPDPNQSRRWVPITWDPDGDGQGETAYVANDFTTGVEKVIRPDAIMPTPETLFAESFATFSPEPNITDYEHIYEVRYSQRLLSEVGVDSVSANPREVTPVLDSILEKLVYATNNYSGGEQLKLGSLISIITRSRSSDNGERIVGQLNTIRQYVLSKTEFIAFESVLTGDETTAAQYLEKLGISRDTIRSQDVLPDFTKFYARGNGQELTAGIAMFDDNGTLYIFNGPYTSNSNTQDFLLMYGPAMLDYLITEYSADPADSEIYSSRFPANFRRGYGAAYSLRLNLTTPGN